MIHITGDTHGTIDVQKLLTFNAAKNDIVIIAGDVALTWHLPESQQHYKKQQRIIQKIHEKPFTTLFIDGNHENFSTLKALPKVEKFGGVVGQLTEKIFHLQRNQIYTIQEKTFYTYGGGLSVDRDSRIEDVSWWREELPTVMEMNIAIDFIKNKRVDYILTHEAPASFIPKLLGRKDKRLPESQKFDSPLAKMFEEVYAICHFKHWYCGHYHTDATIDNLTCLFNNFITIE